LTEVEEKEYVDREEDVILYIKKFVDKHGFGPRSEDLIKKFTPNPWSSRSSLFTHLGKLLDQDVIEKKADPKKAKDRYSRYYIKKSFEKEAIKIEVTNSLREQELAETDIPSKIAYDFFFNRIKSQVDYTTGFYKNLLMRLKLTGKEEEFFSNSYVHMVAQQYSKFLKISILHPKGQKSPNLDIIFDEKNTTSGKELLVSYFAHVAGEYEKEVGKMLPFQLLLTFDPPDFNLQELKKEIETQIKSLYQKWLLEFDEQHSEKKEKEFYFKLIKYDTLIHQKRQKALQKN